MAPCTVSGWELSFAFNDEPEKCRSEIARGFGELFTDTMSKRNMTHGHVS